MDAPKISVIIPLYNAERFIRECLISVLASKFKDYEVLVVDDCSTDNSLAEVRKLLPHFDGRLKIFSTEENSGGPGLPRNIGIKNSSGKYITFIDNDDMILPDALENFYALAESYGADVVHTEKYFYCVNEFDGKHLDVCYMAEKEKLVSAPTFVPVDLDYRMWHLIYGKWHCIPWSRLYRREFLLENKIDFPARIQFGEDFVFFVKCLCLAEKYLLVPHVTNLRRLVAPSGSHVHFDTAEEAARSLLKILTVKAAAVDEFICGLEFFKANPACRQDVLKFCISVELRLLKDFFGRMPPHKVQEIFLDALQNPALNPRGKNIFTAHLCAEKFSAR